MMALLWLFVSVAGYLGGGRLVFWGLTLADWPKARSRNDCGHSRSYHRHNATICVESRDLIKSRDRRVTVTYFWPLLFPFFFAVALVLFVAHGSYKVITYPITNAGERRARRLALERDVAAAEEAARQAAQPPPRHATGGRPVNGVVIEDGVHTGERPTRPQPTLADDDYDYGYTGPGDFPAGDIGNEVR
jgi:hypothetical protein